MAIEIYIEPKNFDEALRRLDGISYALQRAVYPAVSAVLNDVKDNLAKHIKAEIPLPDKISKKSIKISNPHMVNGDIMGSVSISSGMVPLIYYDVKPPEITARQGLRSNRWPGFTFSLRTGSRRSSRERVEGSGLPFIARMPNGHVGVYYRTPSQLKQSYGPTIQYHITTPEVEQSIIEKANDIFPLILARYVEQTINEYGSEI